MGFYIFFEKEKIMLNKKIWLGMLVMVLAFGMTVLGCEEDTPEEEKKDTNPLPPTGLSGTAVGNSVQLTWNLVDNADKYLVQYKWYLDNDDKYQTIADIQSASYTVTGLDSRTTYRFRVAVQNTNGLTSEYSWYISVDTSDPQTGTVFINSMSTTHGVSTVSGTQYHNYTITVELKLSDGAFWKWENSEKSTVDSKMQTWTSLTPPSGFSFDNTSSGGGLFNLKTILVRYQSLGNSSTLSAPNLTATIDQSKLSEMRGYTNITGSLTLGTPSTASSNAWVDNN
jgi:hypothetical protein